MSRLFFWPVLHKLELINIATYAQHRHSLLVMHFAVVFAHQKTYKSLCGSANQVHNNTIVRLDLASAPVHNRYHIIE